MNYLLLADERNERWFNLVYALTKSWQEHEYSKFIAIAINLRVSERSFF